jgi:CBS domain-containing protein
MRADDVMTRAVVTITPSASVQDAAKSLIEHRISGLPVVDDDGRVIGIITEADLIARRTSASERRSWWHRFVSDPERLAEDYRKTAGSKVGDVMTRAVICIGPDMPVEAIATLLTGRGIKRVPVVVAGRLVGIVSRADLVKALAIQTISHATATDADIIQAITERLGREEWARHSGVIVKSHGGVVDLWGIVGSENEKAATEALAGNVSGVTRVRNYLTVTSAVLPYVYWTVKGEEEKSTPAELRKDPWDPQDPTATP